MDKEKNFNNHQALIKKAGRLVENAKLKEYNIVQAQKLIEIFDKSSSSFYGDITQHTLARNIIRLLEPYTYNYRIRQALSLFLDVVKKEIIA